MILTRVALELDATADAVILRQLGIEEDVVELFIASTMLLQLGVELGCTLRTLGNFVRRQRLYDYSSFEKAVQDSRYVVIFTLRFPRII